MNRDFYKIYILFYESKRHAEAKIRYLDIKMGL